MTPGIAVEDVRNGEVSVELKAKDALPIAEQERCVAIPNLEHHPRASRGSEARVEETRIVRSELPALRVEGDHLGADRRRYRHPLVRRKHVERVWLEHERAARGRDRFPERSDVVAADLREIEERSVRARAITDDVADVPRERGREEEAVFDQRSVPRRDERLLRVKRLRLRVADPRVALLYAKLDEPIAGSEADRKAPRDQVDEEPPVIPTRDLVERFSGVGDHAREHVEAAGRALRVCARREPPRERERLGQLDEIRDVRLDHGAVPVERQLVDVVAELAEARIDPERAREEAAADAVGARAEPEIEAVRLELPLGERRRRRDRPGLGEEAKMLNREDAVLGRLGGRIHGARHRHAG